MYSIWNIVIENAFLVGLILQCACVCFMSNRTHIYFMLDTGQNQNPNPLMNPCLPFTLVFIFWNMLNWPKTYDWTGP